MASTNCNLMRLISNRRLSMPPKLSVHQLNRHSQLGIPSTGWSRFMLHGVVRTLEFDALATETAIPQVVEEVETEVAEGYTMTQFCDRMIEVLLNEKAQTNDWQKLLAFREEWKKYRERFYRRCRERASAEKDQVMKDKLATLSRKLKRIDDEMEIHEDLLKQIRENPPDLNLIVAARRKDFNGGFFNHLNIIAEMNDGLEERDEMADGP